jgi:NADH-quinone oxidoreductase subunit G
MLAHRVRKAATRGARVSFVNPARFTYLFPVAHYSTVPALSMVAKLASIGRAVAEASQQEVPAVLAFAAAPDAADRAAAAALLHGERRCLLLGGLAERHPAYADLRRVAATVAALAAARLAYLPTGGNAAGLALAGVLPHRTAGAQAAPAVGLDAGAMWRQGLAAYVLLGGIEPGADVAHAEAVQALRRARFVLSLSPYANESDNEHAHVVLPIGTFAETSGSFVNVEGRWQSFAAAARAVGESRPAWKVLRVLGNLLGLAGFEYQSSDEVREELQAVLGDRVGQAADTRYGGGWAVTGPVAGALEDLPMYQVDPIVRRAPALQQTQVAARPRAVY